MQNRRSHLSLLAEAFHDILAYKPPAIYKAPAAASADQTFVLESLSQLGNSLNKFLPGAESSCTAAEMLYFETIGVLTVLITYSAGGSKDTAAVEGTVQLVEAVRAAIESLQIKTQGTGDGVGYTVSKLASFHDLTMLHDASTATTLTTQYIHTLNERAKATDRSGSSNLPKEIIAQVKSLQTLAEKALKEGKAWAATLKDEVGKGDFEVRLRAWVFEGDDEDGLKGLVEKGTVGEVVASWRMVVKGWQTVKWE